ncbi:MAG: hypothetical protein NZ517_08750, partial [Candidatus Nitrosocaldus sp.]|nr:hypothetical protein [Candidatus Nitrosocaldus sp.]
MKHILFVMPVILSALVVIKLTLEDSSISLSAPAPSTSTARADVYTCEPKSIEQVKPAFPVREPAYLPEGYRLQVVDIFSYSMPPGADNVVALNYAKYEMCHAIGLGDTKDVIVILVTDVEHQAMSGDVSAKMLIDDPTAYYKGLADSYNSAIPDAAKLIDKPESTIPLVRMIEVNGHAGIAREPMKGYSVFIINDG